eukprot:TRINITY_DN15104_c0_g1_i1.p5 TRINITY_DN15104_c0_g1~~TRINITY_DN15104_c0_g1_i1.p5  ORF type:complete len:108 (+),score=23.90 TRINITY_DN15104_c0_g1_i1:608-931(+)
MKQGKNRPLEEDEIEFLEKVRQDRQQQQAEIANQEKTELEHFKKARTDMVSGEIIEERPTKKRKVVNSTEVKQSGFKLNTLVKKQTDQGEQEGFNLLQDYDSDSNDD